MADEVKLITFAGETVSPLYDGLMQELYTGGGGIITGATVTIKDASTLHITGGYGALCGREFEIFASDIPVTLSSSGNLNGRLYLHMDLSQSTNPITLLVETGSTLTPVQQDANVNTTNGVYEINLATFTVGTSAISNLQDVAPKAVKIPDALSTLNSAIATKADASALPDLKVYQLTASMSAHQGNGNFRVLNMPSNVVPVCIAPWNATDCNWTLFYSSTAHAWFAHASKFTDGSAETSATITTMYIYYVKYTT